MIPQPNTVLDIKSHAADQQGVQAPHSVQSKITLQDEVTTPNGSVAVNNGGLLFYEETSTCFRYYNLANDQWWSLCGTPPPADAELRDCYKAIAVGTYLEKNALTVSNYLQVPIHVNRPGTYTITSVVKDAANNIETYYFTTNGTFPNTGDFVVNIPGAGMPTTSGNHIVNITINGVLQACDIPIKVMPLDPDYVILDVQQLNPNWNILTPLADGTYKVAVKLLVYNPGTWGLTTSQVNGYTFGATGEISSAQGFNPEGSFPQTVTVLVPVAAGQALVYGTGIDKFVMSTTTSKTASNRDFNILLTKGGYKLDRVDCSAPNLIIHISSPTAMQSTDTLMNGKYFVPDAYIKIPIIVTAPGQYVVYADVAGALFATCTLQGSKYVINPVTLTSATSTLTLYPVGNLDDTNPNRIVNTSVLNTNIPIKFSAGDNNGPDGVAGNADDWEPESGYYQQDQFCVPSVVVKPSVARFADLKLATQAATTGTGAYSNNMRYSYNTALGNQTQSRLEAATQGVYTIDYAGNTPVTAIKLEASYSVAGSYDFRVVLGNLPDTIAYTAKGELPPIPSGQTLATATIILTPFKKDDSGNNFVALNGSTTTDPTQYVWNTKDGNQIPITEKIGKTSDIINYYTTSDNPATGIMSGKLEVPLWFGYRSMKIVSLGSTDFSLNNASSVGYSMFGSPAIFGYQGIVPVGGINLVRTTTVPATANNGIAMKNLIRDADIVLVQYVNGFGNSAFAQIFADFVNMGGALMYSCETPDTYISGVMNAIYNTSAFTAIYEGGRYRFAVLQQKGTPEYDNNPILNGTFTKDSVNVLAFGNDNGTGSYLTMTDAAFNAAAPNAVILAKGAATNRIFAFYDPSKGLLYCGDGGWLASNTWNNTSTTTYPLVTYQNFMPRSKPNFVGTAGYPTNVNGPVDNAYLFCNYISWAIDWAAVKRDHSLDATW